MTPWARSSRSLRPTHAERSPTLITLPENSSTWFDARKIVDRLAFDARELLEYVSLVDPGRASEILRGC
jgi:hypothetical protein